MKQAVKQVKVPAGFVSKQQVEMAIWSMGANATRSRLAKRLKISQMKLADVLTQFGLN